MIPQRSPRHSPHDIARICHEANRALCAATGDDSQVPWADAPQWQRESAQHGVEGILDGSIRSPEQAHESWCREKTEAGWVFGPTKDAEAKTHPCLVPYDELPAGQRDKDALFFSITHALSEPVEYARETETNTPDIGPRGDGQQGGAADPAPELPAGAAVNEQSPEGAE